MKPKKWYNISQPTKIEIIINIYDLLSYANFAFLPRPYLNLLSTKAIAADLDQTARQNFSVEMIYLSLFHTVTQSFCLFYRKRSTLSSDEPEGARKGLDIWKTNMDETCFLREVIF